MRRLIARMVLPEVRRLRRELASQRATAVWADGQLAEDPPILRHAAGHPADWWQGECARLRALCSAQEDLIARLEGRPVQAELPPERRERLHPEGPDADMVVRARLTTTGGGDA